MWGADWPWLLRTSRRRHGQGRRVVLPLRRAKSAGARGRTGMIISNRFGLLQGVALSSRNVPRKASSCHPRLRLVKASYCCKASPCHHGAYRARLRPAIKDLPNTPQVNRTLTNHNHSMIVLPIVIRHVMIMALMLAIAMIMMAKQRCTSIVRTRGSQPATLSTKLKRQQHLLARH